jgi:outer membrane protein assembly factor BamB
MKRMWLWAGAVAVAGTVVSAADWPEWRGPNRDGMVQGFEPPAVWPETLTKVWSVTLPKGDASPALAAGKLFVTGRDGDTEVVTALDVTTGKELWKDVYAAPFPSCIYNDELGRYVDAGTYGVGGPVPKSTPLVREGRVYAYGVSGVISALNTNNGEVLWRKDAPLGQGAPMVGSTMSPIIDNNLLFIHLPGSQAAIKCPQLPASDARGPLTAYDSLTGQVRWTWSGDGAAYGSPLVVTLGGTRQVVSITEKRIVGLAAATGKLLWERPLQSPDDQNIPSPILYRDTIIYGALENPILAIRPVKSGDTWTTERVWENRSHELFMNTPVLVGDTAYGFSYKLKGHYFTLDARTGETLWAGPGRVGENVSIQLAAGFLLMLENNGELVVATPNGNTFDVVKRYTVANSQTWAHPIIDGKRIIVRGTDGTITAWTLP